MPVDKSALYKANQEREIAKEAKEMADAISKFINRMSGGAERAAALGKALAADHRTLQQTHMHMVYNFLKCEAQNYFDDFYDARNEATVKLASRMMEPIASDVDLCLPYI